MQFVYSYDRKALSLLLDANRTTHSDTAFDRGWKLEHFEVMHQFCRIMTTHYKHVLLWSFVLEQLEVRDIALTEGRVSFEMRQIHERYHLVQLSSWLLVDLESRLTAAWRGGAVRYNILFKDFIDPPNWYISTVEKLSNWRDRTKKSVGAVPMQT